MDEVRRTTARVHNQIIGSASISRRRRDRCRYMLGHASCQRNTRRVKSNRKPCRNRRGVQGQSSSKGVHTLQTDNSGPRLSLRNRLRKRRSGDIKIASRWETIQTVYSKMWGGDRGCINNVIVYVDNRPSHRRTPDAREGDVEEKPVTRGETT